MDSCSTLHILFQNLHNIMEEEVKVVETEAVEEAAPVEEEAVEEVAAEEEAPAEEAEVA